MSWCLAVASGLNVSADLSQRNEPCTLRAPQSAWFSTSVTSPWPAEAFFGSLLVSMNVSGIIFFLCCQNKFRSESRLCRPCDPSAGRRRCLRGSCLEAVGRLPLEIEQRLGRAQTVLL